MKSVSDLISIKGLNNFSVYLLQTRGICFIMHDDSSLLICGRFKLNDHYPLFMRLGLN